MKVLSKMPILFDDVIRLLYCLQSVQLIPQSVIRQTCLQEVLPVK